MRAPLHTTVQLPSVGDESGGSIISYWLQFLICGLGAPLQQQADRWSSWHDWWWKHAWTVATVSYPVICPSWRSSLTETRCAYSGCMNAFSPFLGQMWGETRQSHQLCEMSPRRQSPVVTAVSLLSIPFANISSYWPTKLTEMSTVVQRHVGKIPEYWFRSTCGKTGYFLAVYASGTFVRAFEATVL